MARASFGVIVPPYGAFGDPAAIAELTAAAEELGYDDAWFGDHVVVPGPAIHLSPPNWYEALTCCLIGLGRTTRLRFGTDVLVVPLRHPVLLAKMLATADQLSSGRIVLGAGSGVLRGEFEALDVPFDERGAIFDEALGVLRALWRGPDPVGFHGRWFGFEDIHFAPRPVRPAGVPVWIGGHTNVAVRRAALAGDGWHPLWPSPEAYRQRKEEILAIRAEHGLADAAFTFSLSCPESRIHDGSRAVAEPHTFDAATSLPREYRDVAPALPRAGERPRFSGTPEELMEDVTAYLGAGVDHFTLRFWSGSPDVTVGDVRAQMELFAERVMPHFVR